MSRPPPALPDRAPSIILIRPRRGWANLGARELWSYRELALFLVWRDLRVRYKQTVFGALWAIIQPLLLMLAFSLFLGRITGIAPAGIPYPLFAFAGLVPWTLLSQSLIASSGSLVGSANLIQKVYFPRLLLPVTAAGSYLIDFAIAMSVLGLLMLYFGFAPSPSVIWLVPLTGLTVAAALAVGILLSAVNVRYRDVRYAVPFFVQFWLIASPVAYSANLVPSQLRTLYEVNPMTGVLEGFRWALFGHGEPAPVEALSIGIAVTTIILLVGLAYFRRVERTFADVI